MTFALALSLAAALRAVPAPMPAHAAVRRQAPRPLTPDEDAALPKGDGRDAVASMCVPCHGILHAIEVPKTPLAWQDTVDDMRDRGASGTDEQADAVVTYLSTYFAAVNVNEASAADIVKIAKLPQADADAIVAYRTAGHTFKSFADLKEVPGIDEKTLDEAKPRLAYRAR